MAGFGNRWTKPNEPPMPDPLAFLLTWTTYGTWLPGDERGWILRGKGVQTQNHIVEDSARREMTEPVCTLDAEQRQLVHQTIVDHCSHRAWHLFVTNVRTNHVHVVVKSDRDPEDVRDQLKAWCTRKLKDLQRIRGEPQRIKWWTERGSQRYIGDEESLEAAILYVRDGQ